MKKLGVQFFFKFINKKNGKTHRKMLAGEAHASLKMGQDFGSLHHNTGETETLGFDPQKLQYGGIQTHQE